MTRNAVVMAVVGVIALAGAAPAGAKITTQDNKSITNADATQSGSLADPAVVPSCASPNPTPPLASSSDFHYDSFTNPNGGPGTSCVHVLVNGGSCGANSGVRAVAYVPSNFDADAIESRYAGASAVANAGSPLRSFSFAEPPGGAELVVHGMGTTGLCTSYSLTVRLAPNAATDGATNIADTSATLHGRVNEESEESTVHFEYGTTTSYGTETASTGLTGAADNDQHSVSQAITGLDPNTVYHYRTVVDHPANGTFPAGTAVGQDRSFQTTGDPTAVTGVATDISTGGATLNGAVNPGGRATVIGFEYGTTLSYGTFTAAQTVKGDHTDHSVAAGVSGLEPATTYHFRVVAAQHGTVVNGDDATFTTAAPPAPAGGTDTGGVGPAVGTTAVLPDGIVPAFTQGPKASPERFRAAKSGASVGQAATVGTRVSYALSEPAKVAFTIERAAPGRKVKGKCVAPNARNRKVRKCVRFVKVKGSFSHDGATGANSFRFTGRVGGKALKPGSYRLVASATDAAGNRSAQSPASFKIVR